MVNNFLERRKLFLGFLFQNVLEKIANLFQLKFLKIGLQRRSKMFSINN